MGHRATYIKRIDTYDVALMQYERIKPWRGDKDGMWRPLHPKRTWRRFEIGKYPDGKIACRLYNTECVVWHPDNSIEIEPWGSRTTNDFVNALVPPGITADFCHNDRMLWVDTLVQHDEDKWTFEKRGYSVNYTIRLKRALVGRDCWVLHEDSIKPNKLSQYRIDRKEARLVAAQYRLTDIAQWLRAVQVMERKPQTQTKRRGWQKNSAPYIPDYKVVEMVESGIDGWQQLADKWGYGCAQKVRMAVYREAGNVIVEDKIDYITSTQRWGMYSAWENRNKRYL